MEGRFLGRDDIETPTCPFCGAVIERPKELVTRMPNEMPVGVCSCGGVYACDVTGHNLGTAMIEALVVACNMDWDLAWNLLPEEDYLEREIKSYDYESHLIVPGGAYEGRRVAGALYFIRLREDIREVTEEGVRRRIKKAAPVPSSTIPRKRIGRRSSRKKEVEALVKGYRVDSLLSMAREDKRIIRNLQRLLYSADSLIRFRAAEAIGKVSAVIAREDPGTISKLLQGLLTSVIDTASSSWGAVDAVGEIISNRPEQFAGYIPHLYQLIAEKELRVEVLRALGKIGGVRPDLIRKVIFRFIPFLKDDSPEIRGYTAMLLGNLKAHEAKEELTRLQDDFTDIEIYLDGVLQTFSISQLASEALNKI